MSRALVVVVFALMLLSCTQRMICPAYQSAYIYDKAELRKKFSYFNDTVPKVYTASKNKYLVADPITYKKKVRTMQTVPMKPVNPVVPDSLKADGMKDDMKAEMDVSGIERNVNDSTAVLRIDTLAAPVVHDSIYVISKEREVLVLKYKPMERKYYVDTVGFNSEQDTYMWYLRDVLVLPDARLAQQASGKGEEAQGVKKKKGLKGFFAGLFKKKDKSKVPQDSTQNIAPVEEDYGYDEFDGKTKDSTAVKTDIQPPAETKKKKGLFSKNKDKPPKKTETPPAKKEEGDDGF